MGQEGAGWERDPEMTGLIVVHRFPQNLVSEVIAREIKVLPDLIIGNEGGSTKYWGSVSEPLGPFPV